jgi:hypothetical protein
MKKETRFALFCMVVIAFLLAGFMVEAYWNCRLKGSSSRLVKGPSVGECLLPGTAVVGGLGGTSPTLRGR